MKKISFLVIIFLVAWAMVGTVVNINNDNMKTVYANSYERKYITLHLDYEKSGYSHSGWYEGDVNSNGLPDGKGTFSTQNQNGTKWTYEGSFRNGHFEGYGAITIPDWGVRREGPFSGDVLTGYGKYTNYKHPERNFTGRFVNDIPLYDDAKMNTAVRYADLYRLEVRDVYQQSYWGNVTAEGTFLIVDVDGTNISDGTLKSLTTGTLLQIVDLKTNRFYKMDLDAMKRYYATGGREASWLEENIKSGRSINAKFVFDIPRSADLSDLRLVIWGGNVYVGQPIKLQRR